MVSPNALFQKGVECESSGNIFGAIENYRAGFNAGSIEAAEALVQLYTGGKYNIHPDATELVNLLEKLASVNSPLALMKLAIINIKTPGFLGLSSPDYKKAATLLERAATLGEPMAAFILGEIIYYSRDYVSGDYYSYLPNFLSEEILPGMNDVDRRVVGRPDSYWCCPHGDNMEKAFQWYKIASDNGIGSASNMIGILKSKETATHVPNRVEAASYFEMGANQGSPAAMTNLGVIHLTWQPGGGRMSDHKRQTLYWLDRASKAGFSEAMIALACYLTIYREDPSHVDWAYRLVCAAAKAGNSVGAQLKVLMDGGTRNSIGRQGVRGTNGIMNDGFHITLYRDIW